MDILEKIEKSSLHLRGGLPTWDNFWAIVQEEYDTEFDWFVQQLHTAPKPIVPIAPGNILFYLIAPECNVDLIDKTKDYMVFDIYHEFVYQHSGHEGYFGLSPLDKLAVVNGKSLDIYYVHCHLLSGEKKVKTLFLNKN